MEARLLRLCGHGEHDDASYIDPELKASPVGRDCLLEAQGQALTLGWLSQEELDDQVYPEWFYDQLAHNYLPAARCAHLIDQLKLDTDDPKAGDVLGSLKRYEGSFTGSDVLYVELTEPITASWLQWALIEAGEPANIHKL